MTKYVGRGVFDQVLGAKPARYFDVNEVSQKFAVHLADLLNNSGARLFDLFAQEVGRPLNETEKLELTKFIWNVRKGLVYARKVDCLYGVSSDEDEDDDEDTVCCPEHY